MIGRGASGRGRLGSRRHSRAWMNRCVISSSARAVSTNARHATGISLSLLSYSRRLDRLSDQEADRSASDTLGGMVEAVLARRSAISYALSVCETSTAGIVRKAPSARHMLVGPNNDPRQRPPVKSSNRRSISCRKRSNGSHCCGSLGELYGHFAYGFSHRGSPSQSSMRLVNSPSF